MKLPEVSLAMADRKLATLPKAEVLTSTDAGCLLQPRGAPGQEGREPQGGPLATLLWEAYAG